MQILIAMNSKWSVLLLLAMSITVVTATHERSNPNADDLSTRVVGGHNSTRGQFPHQALIFLHYPGGRGTCGGTLISSRWVLTAAHCTTNVETFEVHLGALYTHNFTEDGRIIRNSSRAIVHPRYLHFGLFNDIALIDLIEPVDFSETIQPAQLPEERMNYHNLPAIISGFGVRNTTDRHIPEIMQWADLQTVSNAKCFAILGPRGILVLRTMNICAVGADIQSGCYGDSGGPLTVADDSRTVIGVVSFGDPSGCHYGQPSVFTRVSIYLDWIHNVTGQIIN